MRPTGYTQAPANPAYLAGQWVPVSSSWVRAVRWTAPDRLDVRTAKGQTIHYGKCPLRLFAGLLGAASKGTFVNIAIKAQCKHLGTT